MKLNPVRYSSCVGESWHHARFKVKYCHKIFESEEVRNATKSLFLEAFEKYQIRYKEIGFDIDHIHIALDIGLRSRDETAKVLKGYVGRKLLMQFPKLKQKYFWGSGLFSPSYYMESVANMEKLIEYIRKQKFGSLMLNQTQLNSYAS